ncbi:hypothetical protein E4T39_07975 [Aureobasidium subglaciale]|nr:hypothetical protein E4T39_07975 [Aureobasidium subglaciale]
MNSAPPPSSFDDDTEFYEESRWQKLRRRIVQEPLIPLGCGLTVWALYEATKSMKSGDHVKTNRMFRRRIYAQGFTLLAMVAGSAYWKKDRVKRKEYNELVDEKKKKDKRDAWIRELEARDDEEKEIAAMKKRLAQARGAEDKRLSEDKARAVEAKIKSDTTSIVRSVLEPGESRRNSPLLHAAMKLWQPRS